MIKIKQGALNIKMKQINIINKELLKQTLFTVAYYNALGYYPTSFFIWKNLIDINEKGNKSSFGDILNVVNRLIYENKMEERNGMYGIGRQSLENNSQINKIKYREQIQKNKISTDKIKKAKRWARASRWVPYLRGLFLTGTLAMKRGGSNSDWDILVVLKKDRIWLGRLAITAWFCLIGKRRSKRIVKNRFCLNQFVVNKKLKFKEKNEFFGNELLMTEDLMDGIKLKNKMMQRNKEWIKVFKPNFKFKQKQVIRHKDFFSTIIQKKIENILEIFQLAEILNAISKKIMIQKIIDNPKTYSPEADIRYSDFFLVFLPKPQREKVKQKAISLLDSL